MPKARTTKKPAAKNDPWLKGHQFTYETEKNPYDYVNDPATGLRPNEKVLPSGGMLTDMNKGTQGVTIPPLAVWETGDWFNDEIALELEKPSARQSYANNSWRPREADEFDTWVVDGQGTPGNWRYRLYILPEDISRTNLLQGNVPKHPMNWPEALKKGTGVSGYSSSWSSPKGPSLPLGTRIRCQQCGHWFEVDDLKDHIECCPGVHGEGDWVIKCECPCSLDDTAKVKPGYPKEVNADGSGDTATERASAGAADAEGGSDAVGSDPRPGTVPVSAQ